MRDKRSVLSPINARTTAHLQLPGGWFHNNSGWISGDHGTLLVDTCGTERRSHLLLDRLRAHVGADTVPDTVLTHAHGDHANGAGLISRLGGTVRATSQAGRTVRSGPHVFPELFDCPERTWGDITPPRSLDVVDSATDLDLGGVTARLLPTPTDAHTDGDLLVWTPHDGVLFTGDVLFNGVTPLALHGSIDGWLSTLDWIADLDPEHVIPGHGPLPPSPAPLVRDTRDYLNWLRDVTDPPATPDFADLAYQARATWPSWHDPERHAVNLRRAHAENHGHAFDPRDAARALRDAAGGRIVLDIDA